ncbi:MAG: GNAT family N-acetyltransferase [Firmicutes bacterium]|nr:GNAT family N-acetyltransferase [Bacillota bacterium]
MVKIRRAEIGDLGEIQSLNNLLFKWDAQFDKALNMDWSFSKEAEEFFAKMIKTQFVWVAEVDCRIVGYLSGSLENKKGHTHDVFAKLENILILDEFRKLGVGNMLFNEFKKQCEQKNVDSIRVSTCAKNINAIDFYEKNGFNKIEITLIRRLK